MEERNISAALGSGATDDSLEHEGLRRVAEWARDLPAPEFPRDKIDPARAECGKGVYQARCAGCHALDGQSVGQVPPIEAIGTDR